MLFFVNIVSASGNSMNGREIRTLKQSCPGGRCRIAGASLKFAVLYAVLSMMCIDLLLQILEPWNCRPRQHRGAKTSAEALISCLS